MRRFNSILSIDCDCGHRGIFDRYIAKTYHHEFVGCRMCKKYRQISIPFYVKENEELTWGYHNSNLIVKLKICSEIK